MSIPKMQVPPAEPFVLPALQIDRDLDSLKIKAHLENIQAFGGSAFVVDKLSVDPHKLTLAMTVTVPSLYVVTDYDVNGRLLLVPLRGKGVFKGNFTNTKVDVKGSGKLITKNGVQFVQLEKIQSKLKVGGMAFKFENKDKTNALITTTASNFINENQRQVLDIVTPIVQETIDEVITQFGDRILGSIPYSEILPE